ncbi:hypothetical protein CEXT_456181 [Caerostris extrusa]|uniref:Uncharacterized protein n=1 Tax=Caerostris extrusa TaxID=172846 RepID=A0AAV4RS85_CAEEX|nr:hypothetical protein CEXT_456181 [Caerostris extrusa]
MGIIWDWVDAFDWYESASKLPKATEKTPVVCFVQLLWVPDSPPAAVAIFKLLTEHDCLSVYLFDSGQAMMLLTWMSAPH